MKPFEAIDFHAHVFPDKVAGAALQFLSGKSGVAPFSDGTAAGLLGSMDRARIDLSVNMPVATHPSQVASINRWCTSLETERLRSFASYHPALDDLSVVREIGKSGFKGIKLHPEFQCFSPGLLLILCPSGSTPFILKSGHSTAKDGPVSNAATDGR